MFDSDLTARAAAAIDAARSAGVRIVTVETCTAGLVSACLTSVPGASEVVERGYVLYHASAKATGLGVPEAVSATHGAVSAEVTRGLAEGGIAHSEAGVSVAVTGYAGPGGGNDRDPVGTCYIAAVRRGGAPLVARHVFSGNRGAVRAQAVGVALEMIVTALHG